MIAMVMIIIEKKNISCRTPSRRYNGLMKQFFKLLTVKVGAQSRLEVSKFIPSTDKRYKTIKN